MEDSHPYEFTILTGYFLHDEEPSSPEHRVTTSPGLGLIDRVYETDTKFDPRREKTQWQRFEHFLRHLNLVDPKVNYKLIYFARHGLGHHNVVAAAVGKQAWQSHWARLDRNRTVTLVDARLAEEGVRQAQALNAFWRDALSDSKIPAPERYYTSPLARCLETVKLTFSPLNLPQGRPFKPIVKELLRERLGVNTCDRRSPRSWIRAAYPDYEIEAGFAEEDQLWDPQIRESDASHVARTKTLLNDIFSTDDKVFLSFTAHSGSVRALYGAIQHQETWVEAGAVVPVLVRAEQVDDSGKGESSDSWPSLP